MSDYRNLWKNEIWKPYAKYSKHHYLFHMQKTFQNGAITTIYQKWLTYTGFLSKRSKFCVVVCFVELTLLAIAMENDIPTGCFLLPLQMLTLEA